MFSVGVSVPAKFSMVTILPSLTLSSEVWSSCVDFDVLSSIAALWSDLNKH